MPNHLVYIIMDSCRYDSYQYAHTPHMDSLGQVERRYSYASWTSPSHQVMLMGLVPHASPSNVFASEVYKREFKLWSERLGIPGLSFKTFVPELSLAKVLKDHGYRTIARVSMPVLNPFAGFNRFFDDYKLMEQPNGFDQMVESMSFDPDAPCFYFLNLGETHFPYMLSGESMPRVSGVHGVLKSLSSKEDTPSPRFFPQEEMKRLHRQQTRCVEHVDKWLGRLLAKAPPQTYFIVTSDHGELFGEEGYFGHGPIMHPKCFEVPYVEGLHPGHG